MVASSRETVGEFCLVCVCSSLIILTAGVSQSWELRRQPGGDGPGVAAAGAWLRAGPSRDGPS